jgi:hypothetical protein
MKSKTKWKDKATQQRVIRPITTFWLFLAFCLRTNLLPISNSNRVRFQAEKDREAICFSLASIEIATAMEARSLTPA